MSTLKTLTSAFLLLLAGFSSSTAALAQTASPSPTPTAAAKTLVLIPYQEPGSTDPHALAISQALSAELAAAGVSVTSVAPIGHLDAVANASIICAENKASALLVPEGRYEQTLKRFSVSFFLTMLKYPTHVEFRLDEIGCDRVVRWSTATTADQMPSGVDSVGNVGAAIDVAFSSAVQAAVHAFATATVTQSPTMTQTPADPAASTPTPTVAATPQAQSTYLLLPFEQPGVADPRAADITHSLLTQLQQRKLNVKVGMPIDHLSAIADAQQLCTGSGAQTIIIPNVRIEQSSYTGRSHAALRLTSLSCNGSVLGHGFAQADMGNGFINNFGAAAVGVSERAMGPAIEQLFPNEHG
ncbi:hypothetical protein EPN44_05980 [bacterium]|nr:MAG: hypothetical protein EPN44_05980 [bacterium]